jgi:hypothetical protein
MFILNVPVANPLAFCGFWVCYAVGSRYATREDQNSGLCGFMVGWLFFVLRFYSNGFTTGGSSFSPYPSFIGVVLTVLAPPC